MIPLKSYLLRVTILRIVTTKNGDRLLKYKKKDIKSKPNTYIYKDQYFDKLNEWQEHQYDPGHYTGGNIPPILSNPGRPFVLGLLFIISSILTAFLIIILVFNSFDKDQILPIIATIIMIIGFCTIQFVAGVRLIQKARLHNQGNGINKRKITITISVVVISVLLIFSIYHLNNHYEQISITSMEQISLKQVDGKNLVYIKSIDKTLSCSYDDYGTLWSYNIGYSFGQKDTGFILEFTYNNFNPKKGRIVKIIN